MRSMKNAADAPMRMSLLNERHTKITTVIYTVNSTHEAGLNAQHRTEAPEAAPWTTLESNR